MIITLDQAVFCSDHFPQLDVVTPICIDRERTGCKTSEWCANVLDVQYWIVPDLRHDHAAGSWARISVGLGDATGAWQKG